MLTFNESDSSYRFICDKESMIGDNTFQMQGTLNNSLNSVAKYDFKIVIDVIKKVEV